MPNPHQQWPAMSLILLLSLMSLVAPSVGSCESRCESSIPFIVSLKRIWSDNFSSAGSWERFLLIIANTRDPAAASLRSQLLRAVGRFQDCVIACEHQFSKRGDHSSSKRASFKFLWVQ